MLYLASGSPRRAELLAQIGVPFTVLKAPDIDETPVINESPQQYVTRMAAEKAAAGRAAAPGSEPVLGADTAVVLDDRHSGGRHSGGRHSGGRHPGGQILGKPGDDEQALSMLRDLQGREHRVISAVCLIAGDQRRLALSDTRVRLRPLADERLRAYVATGEGRDKAGAYGIQGLGAALVVSLSGSYSGVVGLPLEETVPLLEWAGVPYWQSC